MRRRAFVMATAGASLIAPALAADNRSLADQLDFPDFGSIDDPVAFGFGQPGPEQAERAAEIIRETDELIKNSSPRMGPIDVAQSFITRYANEPELISQWPAPSAWNPLIVAFLRSTGYPANNDMIAWCGAFVNWCIEHSLGKQHSSGSASSQSFLSGTRFRPTVTPARGDLAVFTVYDKDTERPFSPSIGHVAFVNAPPAANSVVLLGGNQSDAGHSSIISLKHFPTVAFPARRHVEGKYVACTMRLTRYVSVVP